MAHITRNNAIIGVKCDWCGKEYRGEKWDSLLWHYEDHEHYCEDCRVECNTCKDMFSIRYARDWFMEGECENCHEETKQE